AAEGGLGARLVGGVGDAGVEGGYGAQQESTRLGVGPVVAGQQVLALLRVTQAQSGGELFAEQVVELAEHRLAGVLRVAELRLADRQAKGHPGPVAALLLAVIGAEGPLQAVLEGRPISEERR